MKIIATLLLLSATYLSQGQAWNSTKVEITREPEFNLHQYESIIIAEVTNGGGYYGRNHSNDVYDELSTSIIEMGGLELVDRQKTSLILQELDFQTSGLVDAKAIQDLGGFASSGVIIVARIQTDDYDDRVVKKTRMVEVNYCKTTYQRVGSHRLSLNVKIIDLQTSKIVYSKTFQAEEVQKSPKVDCATPNSLDAESIYNACLSNMGDEFKNLFIQSTYNKKVTFQTHGKINDELKQAITFFNINEFDQGFDKLQTIATTAHEKAKSQAWYNLAIMQYYMGKSEEAYKSAKLAYVANPKNSDCLEIIDALKPD